MELLELKDKLLNGNYTIEDFKNYYKKIENELNEFLSLLEEAYEINKDIDYLNFLKNLKGEKVSDLMDRLKKFGYAIRKNQFINEAFKNMGYRLLEQARAGKRDEVFYGFLRIFISSKENFPLILIEAFKPHYSEEIFKILIFSFLSGIIGQEEQISNKEA